MDGKFCSVLLYNPKFDENVASVFRCAQGFDVDLISVVGHRYKKHPMDTGKSYKHVPYLESEDISSFECFIPKFAIPVAVEFVEDSKCLTEFAHPARCCYIFGPEDSSIPKEIQNICRFTVKIPTNICLNLANSVHIVMYDRILKIKQGRIMK